MNWRQGLGSRNTLRVDQGFIDAHCHHVTAQWAGLPHGTLLTLALSLILAANVTSVAALAAAAPGAMPVNPALVIGATYEKLVSLKGQGKEAYGSSAEGKVLSSVQYVETWFNWPEPLLAQYHVTPDGRVGQITLLFPAQAGRTEIMAEISKHLGTPEEGPSPLGSPSEYYAIWVKDLVRYSLEDYSDRIELYMEPARFAAP